MSQNQSLPYVGQLVDYYPDNETRAAALVVEVLQTDAEENRPAVRLQVFLPDGQIDFVECKAAQEDEPLEDTWGFQHEFALQGDHESDGPDKQQLGSKSNDFVGNLNPI